MSVEISIKGVNVTGGARLLDNATIDSMGDNTKIDVDGVVIDNKSVVLENLNINSVMNGLENRINEIDANTAEARDIRCILEEKTGDKKQLLKHIANHLQQFTQGVLASVVANYLTVSGK